MKKTDLGSMIEDLKFYEEINLQIQKQIDRELKSALPAIVERFIKSCETRRKGEN